MGLEIPLMKDSEGNDIEDFYEMPNGCLCCSSKYNINFIYYYRGDLINTLDTLLTAKKNDIDYILVETNGLSDPSTIIKTFWLDDGLGSHVKLHSCIILIDAKSFINKINNEEPIEVDEA